MEPKIKFKGGGSFVNKPPKFSLDGQTIYVAWKNNIICYNTKTAKRLKTFKGLRDSITDFCVHYFKNVEVVTACSVRGDLVSWKADVGLRLLKLNISVKGEIDAFHFVDQVSEGTHCRFLISWLSNKSVHFGLVNTENCELVNIPLKLKIESKYHVSVSSDAHSQSPFMAITCRNWLYYMNFSSEQVYQHRIQLPKYFTCVACSPVEECVITGDSLGAILLWYDLESAQPSRAIYHWHTLPVHCLTLSYFGTTFYSGGGESVLVKWHMDNPHEKLFLPRLSSTLEHVAVSSDNQFIAVATADNAVQVLDSTMNVVSVIQHLVLGTKFSGGIAYDYRTKAMILNGITGHVQFYSPHDMNLLYNLDIVNQNKLSQEQDVHIENTNVTKFAVSSHGLWLATSEERPDDKYSFELRLKFWCFNVVKQQFELNTSIELPHEKSITQILFQPKDDDNLRCVTIGKDKKFKVWEMQDLHSVYKEGKSWNCARVGFYRNFDCEAIAFSTDGSLISVGFGPVLTTWLPETCELKCSLVHPNNRANITALQFGVHNECHLVVTATENDLSVWNLLSLCMVWTVPLQVSLLVSNPTDLHLAVFTKDQKLFIFYPGSSSPLHTQTLEENVVAAAFIPNNAENSLLTWCRRSQLFFLTDKQEMFCVGTDSDENETLDLYIDNIGTSLFSYMQPKTQSSKVSQSKPIMHLTDFSCKNQQLKKLLDNPVHTMVPIRFTCEHVLKSFILERKIS
ncbi:hypothetical protein RI129_010687 [Pyrocoelia pectoralis]|uniref:WD repeat-containing protein 75 second beta-propeller domain-containing protein n=1 Tax=Pyrocoelia pectoralis TaxID=417401 RepID=A0AAN7ZGQ3_9COLE